MSRIELASEVSEDLERMLERRQLHELAAAPDRIEEIIQGMSAFEYNPLIGHKLYADVQPVVHTEVRDDEDRFSISAISMRTE